MKKQVSPKQHKLTVKEINDIVWNNNWKGPVDHQALKERLVELMNAEKHYHSLGSEMEFFGRFIKKCIR